MELCDGEATRIAIAMSRYDRERTDGLGADPDTAIYLEPLGGPLGGFFLVELRRKSIHAITHGDARNISFLQRQQRLISRFKLLIMVIRSLRVYHLHRRPPLKCKKATLN